MFCFSLRIVFFLLVSHDQESDVPVGFDRNRRNDFGSGRSDHRHLKFVDRTGISGGGRGRSEGGEEEE